MRILLFDFLNAYPYQRILQEASISYTLLSHPYEVVEAWQKSSWDAALLPFAIVANQRKTLTKWGIGSKGKIQSVILLSQIHPSEWEYISTDGRSFSSLALLRWCMKKKGLAPLPILTTPTTHNRGAHLFIGDEALRRHKEGGYILDIGELVRQICERPVIFAIWWAKRQDFSTYLRRLWRRMMSHNKSTWVEEAAYRYGFSPKEIREYWSRILYALPSGAVHFWKRAYTEIANSY
ncbi:MAG: MqnA/MqnD/SBP family protein [Bacteroidia bacterium]|nr:hypothetical protein [Bacteroidia bacterium]MDW8135015.1 MqnA/MqnD/SBP family protein [Bacteroidia bacterium]